MLLPLYKKLQQHTNHGFDDNWGAFFAPPPGQWSDPKSPGTIGLKNRFRLELGLFSTYFAALFPHVRNKTSQVAKKAKLQVVLKLSAITT